MSGIQQIVVLGGGSAGWLTAARLAAQFIAPNNDFSVTLVESPDVKTLGVGEGSWPSLRHTLNQIGISERTFLAYCGASPKQGSTFVGWKSGLSGNRYHHPFTNPLGYNEVNLPLHWQSNEPATPFAHYVSAQTLVCEQGLAPKQVATPEYAHVCNYGYHFDADKLAQLLKQHCIERLGVRYIQDHISAVDSHPDGDIKALIGREQGPISGDLFIDCSGLRGQLIGQHFKVDWLPVNSDLLTDAALALQVPYATDDAPIASTTIATAQSHGWIWDIGLAHRRGIGFAYSRQLCRQEQALETLHSYLASHAPHVEVSSLTPRSIHFDPGYRSHYWQNNCIAIGMSAGFIEPLEASALAMIEMSINLLCDAFPTNREHREVVSKQFNQRMRYRWERVIDFVRLHYLLSDRDDSEYWRGQRDLATDSEFLQERLALWRYQAPSRFDFMDHEEVFSSTSYQYILYGMNYASKPHTDNRFNSEQARAAQLRKQVAHMQQQYQQGLPRNREFLRAYCEQGEVVL